MQVHVLDACHKMVDHDIFLLLMLGASMYGACMHVQGPSAAYRGSTAAKLLEDITAALGAAEQEAGNNLTEAKEKLLALKTAKVSVAEKVSLMQDVLMKVISAWEVKQSFKDDINHKFKKLARRVRQWQAATASLECRVTALEHAMTGLKELGTSLEARVADLQGSRASAEAQSATIRNQLSILMEAHESRKRDIFLGECAFSFAKLLQEHTYKVCYLTLELCHHAK